MGSEQRTAKITSYKQVVCAISLHTRETILLFNDAPLIQQFSYRDRYRWTYKQMSSIFVSRLVRDRLRGPRNEMLLNSPLVILHNLFQFKELVET